VLGAFERSFVAEVSRVSDFECHDFESYEEYP